MTRIICWRILRRVLPVPGGRWIPYGPAHVAAQHAANLRAAAAVLVCVTVGGSAAAPLPPAPAQHRGPPVMDQPWSGLPPPPVLWLPPEPTWRDTGKPVHRHDVPEPSSLAALAAGLAGLMLIRRKRA